MKYVKSVLCGIGYIVSMAGFGFGLIFAKNMLTNLDGIKYVLDHGYYLDFCEGVGLTILLLAGGLSGVYYSVRHFAVKK